MAASGCLGAAKGAVGAVGAGGALLWELWEHCCGSCGSTGHLRAALGRGGLDLNRSVLELGKGWPGSTG